MVNWHRHLPYKVVWLSVFFTFSVTKKSKNELFTIMKYRSLIWNSSATSWIVAEISIRKNSEWSEAQKFIKKQGGWYRFLREKSVWYSDTLQSKQKFFFTCKWVDGCACNHMLQMNKNIVQIFMLILNHKHECDQNKQWYAGFQDRPRKL